MNDYNRQLVQFLEQIENAAETGEKAAKNALCLDCGDCRYNSELAEIGKLLISVKEKTALIYEKARPIKTQL